MRNTDIKSLKNFCKNFFDMGNREPHEKYGFILSHTYSANVVFFSPKEKRMLDLLDDKGFKKWRKEIFDVINRADDVWHLYIMVNNPYRLLWVQMASPFLGDKDLASYWAYAWIESESPNHDTNVSLEDAVEMFMHCKKNLLMSKDDYKIYEEIPEKITLYRGVRKGHAIDGLSYTADRKKAVWFANRWFPGEGRIVTLTIPKDYVLAYLNTRDEDEYVVNIPRLKEEGLFNSDKIIEDCGEEE